MHPRWRFCWLLSPACQLAFEFGELGLRDYWFPVVESRCCFYLLTGALREANDSRSLWASSVPSLPWKTGDSKPLSGTAGGKPVLRDSASHVCWVLHGSSLRKLYGNFGEECCMLSRNRISKACIPSLPSPPSPLLLLRFFFLSSLSSSSSSSL